MTIWPDRNRSRVFSSATSACAASNRATRALDCACRALAPPRIHSSSSSIIFARRRSVFRSMSMRVALVASHDE
jgi:hypothetical protein